MDDMDKLWYAHIEHCDQCADEENDRCLIGECIFLEIVDRQKKRAVYAKAVIES